MYTAKQRVIPWEREDKPDFSCPVHIGSANGLAPRKRSQRRQLPLPIDHWTFLHFFWNYKDHLHSQSSLFLDSLPKKLNTGMLMLGPPGQPILGWGLHIFEGPNQKLTSLCMLVVVVASFIVSLTYSLVIHSLESGFGIGQWIVAVGSVGLSAIYFQLSE